uniref:Putative RdRp n=1 Tax=Alloteropsis cryptic virus 2 TaxID=2809262 RepID=A0A890CB09_9VIRU|nr:putative RdRp [Alloteropsis cryptic virus 2]
MSGFRSALFGFNFTNFASDFEETSMRHTHVVRREHAVTYVDEYALEHIRDVDEKAYDHYLKGWSRSYYLPEKHLEAVMSYASPNFPASRLNVGLYNQAIQVIKNEFRSLPRVRAFDVLTELDQVPYKQSSAAGYDYAGAKGPIGGENHKRAISRAKAILWSAIKSDGEGIEHVINSSVPDVGYTRTQLADLYEKTKVRQVWGRAFHYIILEGVVAYPIIQLITQNDTFIHAGTDPTFSVPALLSDVSSRCDWIYSLDWKSFDSSVSRFEINTAFDIIKELVIFPNYETEQCFEITRQLFIHKKVAAPDGKVYFVHKGIPSGSYYTSIIGSIINRLRIEYLWRMITGQGPMMCYTLGDDSLVGDNQLVTPSKIEVFANSHNWYFNAEKTEYSRVPEFVSFLGRTYRGGMNVRDLKKCLRLLTYTEYPVESGRISAYRAKSIHEDSGKLSQTIGRVAQRLERHYGMASEDEVPSYFRRYVPFM